MLYMETYVTRNLIIHTRGKSIPNLNNTLSIGQGVVYHVVLQCNFSLSVGIASNKYMSPIMTLALLKDKMG
jgi:hypothetical protein